MSLFNVPSVVFEVEEERVAWRLLNEETRQALADRGDPESPSGDITVNERQQEIMSQQNPKICERCTSASTDCTGLNYCASKMSTSRPYENKLGVVTGGSRGTPARSRTANRVTWLALEDLAPG